jgi:ABC-type microcin C transport system duplicated ATPase subunit YejF
VGLPTRWISHLSRADQDTKKNFEAAVRNSTTALGRLKDILQEDLDSIDRAETAEKQFEDPNWSHKQAYWNGQRSKVLNLLKLVNLTND